jgi:ligand-binding sensor domain-containing protein
MFRALLYSIVLCFVFVARLSAQSYNFRNYSVEHGLSYIHIQDIFQDDKGYLWTGGYGGLSSFDGLKFTNYSPRNGLKHYSVQAIVQDAEKRIVVGTIEGLSVFDGKKFTNYGRAEGLGNERVNALAVTGKTVSIGTEEGLFYLTDNKITSEKRLGRENIRRLKGLPGGVAVATPKKLILLKSTFAALFSFSAASDTTINCFEFDQENRLWLGTNKGLFRVENGKIRQVLLSAKEITCLYSDKPGSLWIGTHENVVNYTGSLKEYSLAREYNANDILSITSDYEKNIWIGTHSGLFKFRDEGFVCYDAEDGLKSTMIYPIVVDGKRSIWFGTERGGLYSFDGKNFTNYNPQSGLPGITVRGLTFDSTGRLWIATENGLCVKDKGGYKKIAGLQQIFIQCLYLDQRQRLWVGLSNGVAVIEDLYGDSPKITRMKLPNNIKSADHLISSFCSDERGNVWMASFISGLYLWDGKQITDVTSAYHLKTRSVSEVRIAKDRTLYIATLDGIYIINPETIVQYKISEEDGLNSDLVYSLLLTDDDKTLWAGTNQGANKIDLRTYFTDHTARILSFGKTEGFKGVECNTGGICCDSSGNFWFGTVNGVVRHTPGKHIANNLEPRISFTSFKLFYDDTLLPQKSVLPSSLNNITFQYAGICLTNPDKVRYMHKLEGFDKKWSPETPQNLVRYSNLPAGKYTFMVKCCNNQDVWNSEPLRFAFTVTPPVWQRWWFIACELGFMGAVIFLIFRIRLNQLRKEQERESRTQIAIAKNELKALRAQMNPHFLFNSLNSIQQFILNHKDEEAVFYLNRFARLMRMILNNSEKQTVTLSEEINALKAYIELERMRFSNKFDFEMKIDDNVDADYEQIPTMLIQPYVENAILHGLVPDDKKGKLSLHFFIKGGFIHAVIEDTGIGRKRSAEINKQSRSAHASMGMKITRDRLRLMGDVQQTSYTSVITDLEDAGGRPLGTRVEISWPAL